MTVVLALTLICASAALAAKPRHAHEHSHRYQVAAALAKALRPWPLGRYAWQLEASGHRWNVNPWLVAGIAYLESRDGLAACGSDLWGFNQCASHPWGSVADGIEYVNRHIRVAYMNGWGLRDVASIGIRWCSCGTGYGYKLLAEVRALGGPTVAVYP